MNERKRDYQKTPKRRFERPQARLGRAQPACAEPRLPHALGPRTGRRHSDGCLCPDFGSDSKIPWRIEPFDVALKKKEKASKQNDVPKQWIDTLNDVASRAILEPIYDWNISVAVEGMFEESAMGNDIDETIAKCDKTVKDIISVLKAVELF